MDSTWQVGIYQLERDSDVSERSSSAVKTQAHAFLAAIRQQAEAEEARMTNRKTWS